MALPRILIAAALSVGLAMAQNATAQDGLLSGPTVEQVPTLLNYGLDGRLEPVEGRPELAAAELLAAQGGIDSEVSERVRAVATARREAMRMLMVDELDAVRVISDLVVAGEADAARDEMRAMWQRFEPGQPHAPLLDDLAEALGPEHADGLRAMVDEYWAALLAQRMGERLERRLGEAMAGQMDGQANDRMGNEVIDQMGGMPGDRVDPQLVMSSDDPVISAARQRLAFQLFQQEVREAYDQSLSRYRELLESINTAIETSDAQRASIREVVLEHIKDTRLEATPEQRRATMVRIYRELDEAQREQLYALLLRQVVPD